MNDRLLKIDLYLYRIAFKKIESYFSFDVILLT